MAACQVPPLHHTMVVHRPMVVLASFLVLPSSATDLMYKAMHLQVYSAHFSLDPLLTQAADYTGNNLLQANGRS